MAENRNETSVDAEIDEQMDFSERFWIRNVGTDAEEIFMNGIWLPRKDFEDAGVRFLDFTIYRN